ncbi:MFS transporter [Streptosporangium sp. NPDC005286]|uniref:MFS transporter n=1 Tax=Streptosporangium sp. NPDC005286 TaxID=3154463 RepID=UPI0033B59936
MKLPRAAWVIALASFLSAVGFGIVVPSLPALGAAYGVGIAGMSVAISGFAMTRLATNLGLTPILRRLPLQPVMAAGLGFQGVATILAGFADDYTTFIILRSVSGVGSAAFTMASTALMVAVSPPGLRGRVMSLQGGLLGIGTVSGPALGGIIVLDPHLPLIVYGVAMCVAAVMTLVFLNQIRTMRTLDEATDEATDELADPEAAVPQARRGTLRLLFLDPLFVTVVVCQAVNGALYYGVRFAILPAYLEVIGHMVGFVGIVLTISAVSQVVATATSGTLSDRVGRFPLLVASYVVGICSFGLLSFAEAAVIAILAFVALGSASGLQYSTDPGDR